MEDKNNVISHPSHYQLDGLDIEVKDVIKSALGTVGFLGYYKGNIIKYILRAHKKNGLEDYKKARQYLDWLIEELDEDAYWDRQLGFLDDGNLTPEESEELDALNKKLMDAPTDLSKEEQERHKELIDKKYGKMADSEMGQGLTPEEAQELNDLSRKALHTASSMTKEEIERHAELITKKYKTTEDPREEYRQNRENFLKLQEKLSKKVTK